MIIIKIITNRLTKFKIIIAQIIKLKILANNKKIMNKLKHYKTIIMNKIIYNKTILYKINKSSQFENSL